MPKLNVVIEIEGKFYMLTLVYSVRVGGDLEASIKEIQPYDPAVVTPV